MGITERLSRSLCRTRLGASSCPWAACGRAVDLGLAHSCKVEPDAGVEERGVHLWSTALAQHAMRKKHIATGYHPCIANV